MADSFAAQLADALGASWPAIARPNQLPPPGDWQVWLLLAGRGSGKTRTLAEWVCQQAASGRAGRIALVAATAGDARDVLVEGQSGILAVSRPVYEPVSAKRVRSWPVALGRQDRLPSEANSRDLGRPPGIYFLRGRITDV